jgi:tetratricopeptide (TPR) repeat protein
VEPYLLLYMNKVKDKKVLASSYYNIGLAKEMNNDIDAALEQFKKSNRYNPTNAAAVKIKRYER